MGGMFLAFPAILPASLTLVKRHDSRADALDDARGGRVAAIALACFAVAVVRPNPSLHRKCYSRLRRLPHSGELKR